jgi:hypothetical protein
MKRKIAILCISFILLLNSVPFIVSSDLIEKECFGFIINYNSDQSYNVQRNISILINQLLDKNAFILWTCENISVLTTKTPYINDTAEIRFFPTGSIAVSFTGNTSIDLSCTSLLYEFNLSKDIEVYHIMQDLTNLKAFKFKTPKIAHYDIPSISSFLYYNRLNEGGFLHQDFLLRHQVVDNLTIEDYNVIIMGGQSGHFDIILRDHFNSIAIKSKQKIREFVESGGGYISSCHGSVMASSGYSRPIILPRDLTYIGGKYICNIFNIKLIDRKVYRALPGGGGAFIESGKGVSVQIVNKSNPVSFGLPEIIDNHEYLAGPMFLENKDDVKSNTDSLAIIEGIDGEGWDWDFMMETLPLWMIKIIPRELKMKFFNKWVDYSIGKTIWVTAKYGTGKVISFGGHPEYPYAKSPPRIVYNAVFFSASEGPDLYDIKESYSFLPLKVNANGPYFATTSNPEIQFEGSVIPKDNVTYYWCWSFGDGYISLEKDPIHRYSNQIFGDYQGVLCVISENNEMGIDTTEITIKQGLTADLSPDHGIFKINESISFSDISYGGFPPYTYYWEFGDNTYSTLQNPEHSYTSYGIFKGNLTIKDSKMVENKKPFLIGITNNSSYKVDLIIENYSRTTNRSINFTAIVKEPFNSNSFDYIYEFNFGDNSEPLIIGPTTDKEITVKHAYNEFGIYYPIVCVTILEPGNGLGKYYNVSKLIVDNHPPNKPKIPIGETFAFKFCNNKYIALGTDPDEDRLEFKFDWGDGSIGKWLVYDWFPNGLHKEIHPTWNRRGICRVRVKTRDKYNIESPWSDPLIVKVI